MPVNCCFLLIPYNYNLNQEDYSQNHRLNYDDHSETQRLGSQSPSAEDCPFKLELILRDNFLPVIVNQWSFLNHKLLHKLWRWHLHYH